MNSIVLSIKKTTAKVLFGKTTTTTPSEHQQHHFESSSGGASSGEENAHGGGGGGGGSSPSNTTPLTTTTTASVIEATKTFNLDENDSKDTINKHWKALKSGKYLHVKRIHIEDINYPFSRRRHEKNHGTYREFLQEVASTLPLLEEISFGNGDASMYLPSFVNKGMAHASFPKGLKRIKYMNLHFDRYYSNDLDQFMMKSLSTEIPDLESIEFDNCQFGAWGRGCIALTSLFTHLAAAATQSQISPSLSSSSSLSLKRLVITIRWSLRFHSSCVQILKLNPFQSFFENCTTNLEEFDFQRLEVPAKVAPSIFLRHSSPYHSHSRLRVLKLGDVYLHTQQAMDAMLDCLRGGGNNNNNNSHALLEELQFNPRFLNDNDDPTAVDEGNNELVVEEDNERKKLREFLAILLPEALCDNRHLRHCRIHLNRNILSDHNPRVPLDIQVSWLVLVRDYNYVLENLSLTNSANGGGSGSVLYEDQRIHKAFLHNLHLNQLGRGKLLQSFGHQGGDNDNDENLVWMEALESCNSIPCVYGNDDLSCLYSLLRLNPGLCSSF